MKQQELLFPKEDKHLTVLSFGGGQDSTAILYKLLLDKEFHNKYVKGDLIVVIADTKNEHDETIHHIGQMRIQCLSNDPMIGFYYVYPEEWATGDWKDGLIGFYEKGDRIGSKAFPKTCTFNLKINPIYKWLNQYVHKTYNTVNVKNKKALKEFVANNNKINMLIGIAKGEEKRASTNEESTEKWMRDCINKQYPLIDLGWDRQACQDYIKEIGGLLPPPSNCILCPFMSYQELLYLYRYNRKWYDKWVELEANKIEKWKHKERNLGVWGEKLLPEALKIAEEKHGHMTEEELWEYKMSHGHCVKSKY